MTANGIPLAERLREFRAQRGLSQEDLAKWLDVGSITVLRWETGTSAPSAAVAHKLEGIGFGVIERSETKQVSRPRLALGIRDRQVLRDAVQTRLCIGGDEYCFEPSPYVMNGPENQIAFFETLYRLQELRKLPCSVEEYCRRLSSVASVTGLNLTTVQYDLEHPSPTATHWNPNYGPHGWHRYVGRFPPHLVRAILNHFGARKGETVCDPFAGSGTTLVEARLLGMKGIGIEVCPLSCLITRTKSQFPSSTASLQRTLERLSRFYHERLSSFVGGRDIGSVTHREVIEREGNPIAPFANYEKWLIPEALLGTSIIVEFVHRLEGFERDAVVCALSSKMRSIGNVDVDVVRAEYSERPRSKVNVLQLISGSLRKMTADIDLSNATHRDYLSDANDITVIESSVLESDIAPESVDYIVSSPPYGVESVSYLRTHLLSYRCLESVLRYNPYMISDKVIGSEYVKENGSVEPSDAAGRFSPTFSSFFHEKLTGERAAKLLHRKHMMMRFFDDMVKVAGKFSEWVRPGGRVAFVVGNKRLGDDIIPTRAIISEIFQAFGLAPDEVIDHKLKCNNSNSEVPWQERTIQEEFVMLFTRGH